MAQLSLTGKTALVTGASSGIGRTTALALAEAGVRVALVGRSRERLDAVAAQAGGGSLALPADLIRPEEVEQVVAQAQAAFGRIDILFANAGLYVPGDVAEGDANAWDELLSVDVNSVFRLVRAVLPGMIAAGSGHIVVTSSVSGHQAIQWEPIYSASKHAIQAFVHGLRRQVAPHNIPCRRHRAGRRAERALGLYRPRCHRGQGVAAREGLRSEDVADAVLFMLTRPANVTIRDLVLLPQNQDI